MKEEIKNLLEKYNNFKDAQIRSVDFLEDDAKRVTIVVQDDDGMDINSVEITFSNISKSHILQNHVLPFLDMMNGVSIIEENGLYGFALGNDTAMLHVHNAPFYIIASEIQIQES